MSGINKLWMTLRVPLHRVLKGEEPAIVKALTGCTLMIAAHYGLHLSSSAQAWVGTGALGLVGWAIRESVTPNATLAKVQTAQRPAQLRRAAVVADVTEAAKRAQQRSRK